MSDNRSASKATKLNVYHDTHLVGQISTADGVKLQFSYVESWLNRKASFPISISIPLVSGFADDETANNFFVNLLPEERIRKRVCEKLGISIGNHFELLKRIGGDCAGALTIVEENATPLEKQSVYKLIPEQKLTDWSEGEQYAFAEVVGEQDVRLSLAGAQDKLPVKAMEADFFLPVGNSPSTHILKFASHYSHLPENETFTTMLGHAAGVETVDVTLHQTKKSRIAVVERYDRIERNNEYFRVHQEDFCQALGTPPEMKYEQEGGPSLKNCIDLIKNVCSFPVVELEKFIRWVLFNWLVYNADAHAKNISLLFSDGQIKLAPFYDLVCTGNYPRLSKKLAMSIGGEFLPGAVTSRHLETFAQELEVNLSYLNELAHEIIERLQSSLDTTVQEFKKLYGDSPILQRIPAIVKRRCKRTLKNSLPPNSNI